MSTDVDGRLHLSRQNKIHCFKLYWWNLSVHVLVICWIGKYQTLSVNSMPSIWNLEIMHSLEERDGLRDKIHLFDDMKMSNLIKINGRLGWLDIC